MTLAKCPREVLYISPFSRPNYVWTFRKKFLMRHGMPLAVFEGNVVYMSAPEARLRMNTLPK